MIFFVLVIAGLTLYGMKINGKGFYSDYISLEAIQPIKGIFILLVFLSHFYQYISPVSAIDRLGQYPFFFLGQMVVAPFLFYSGYGIMGKLICDRGRYIARMPSDRIFKLLFQFCISVLLFYAAGLWMGNQFSVPEVLLSLIGWKSLGNSNWYIFCTLVLYCCIWVAFSLCKKLDAALCVMTGLVAIYAIILWNVRYQSWWMDTCFCFVAGMWYARYKTRIEAFVFSNNRRYMAILGISTIVFAAMYFSCRRNPYLYNLIAVLFTLIGVMITTKIKISNKVLSYCGTHLFGLFILQRLPMIVLQGTAIAQNIYVYFLSCLVITFILSYIFDLVVPKLYGGLVKKRTRAMS